MLVSVFCRDPVGIRVFLMAVMILVVLRTLVVCFGDCVYFLFIFFLWCLSIRITGESVSGAGVLIDGAELYMF